MRHGPLWCWQGRRLFGRASWQLAPDWQVRASVLNVFNRDAREPTFAPGNIPFDIPLPRRAFNVELSYRM